MAKNLARKLVPSAPEAGPPARAASPSATPLTGGRVHDLDRLLHEQMRLAIVSALAVNESLTFTSLKKLLETTDGNLSIHARKLEEAGYVACEKYFEGRVPKTEFRITAQGRKAFHQYLDHMEALIKAMREPH